jgi:hypothetical protein
MVWSAHEYWVTLISHTRVVEVEELIRKLAVWHSLSTSRITEKKLGLHKCFLYKKAVDIRVGTIRIFVIQIFFLMNIRIFLEIFFVGIGANL